MQIVRVTITNYRGIKSLAYYPAQHNIIVGQTNAGKSTLLAALALVLDPDVGRRYWPVEEADFHARKMTDAEGEPTPISIEVTLGDLSEEQRRSFLDYWEPWDSVTRTLLEDAGDIGVLDDARYQFALRMAFRAAYDVRADALSCLWYYPKLSFIGDSLDYQPCSPGDRERVGFFLIPAERDIRKALSFSRYSALDKALRHDGVRLDAQIAKIVEQVRGKAEILFENDGFSRLMAEMEEQVGDMLQLRRDVQRRLSFELSDLAQYDVMSVLRAFVALEGQEQAYPIACQGAGARQILVLAALQLLSQRRGSSIIAIEEPENGLHPHMQRALVSGLLRGPSQTFITTHSVAVAEAAKQEYLFCLLDRGNGLRSVTPVICADAGPIDNFREVSKVKGRHPSEFLEALFAPVVLLCEGESDREGLPPLLRTLCQSPGSTQQDLDGLGIAVLPCDGISSIPKVAPYFTTYLGKRVYGLVDNEKWTAENRLAALAACDCVFIWPERHAMERVLLAAAKDATIERFIRWMTEMGEQFFDDTQTLVKDAEGRRDDVFRFLKKDKTRARLFAEMLPVEEIATPVQQLLGHLNSLHKGLSVGAEVQLGL